MLKRFRNLIELSKYSPTQDLKLVKTVHEKPIMAKIINLRDPLEDEFKPQ